MKVRYLFFLLIVVFLMPLAHGQENWVIQYKGHNIFHVQNHQISDSAGQVLYSIRANLIFREHRTKVRICYTSFAARIC